jgi:hypothetical protein
LLDITETVGRLRNWHPIGLARLQEDIMLRWAVEHGLHLAAEALFDAGNHVLATGSREFDCGCRPVRLSCSPAWTRTGRRED